MPGGVARTFIPTRDAELKGAFDEWLARIVCFAFSISPQGFLAQMNRATAETAQQTAISEGLAPIQSWVKQLVDYLLITEFDAPDLEFCWRDEREVDPQKAASVAQIYVTNGIKTVNEARSDLGLDPVAGGEVPLVFTGSGPVALAKAAGAPLAKYSPDQLRDERGRWTSGGSGAGTQPRSSDPSVAQELFIPGRVPFFARPPIAPRFPPNWPEGIGRPMLPRSGQTPKEAAGDAPSWLKGEPPGELESPDNYAERLMDGKYPDENWRAVPKRMKEYRKIKKYYRHWEKPDAAPPLDPGERGDNIA